MDFSDFLAMDVIINKDKSLVASFLGPKTKRQRRKAYERWLNTYPGFDEQHVSQQRLTEAAGRMVYGNEAVDHYLAMMGHHFPWLEPFVGSWDGGPDLEYFAPRPNLRYHVPTYNAAHYKQ